MVTSAKEWKGKVQAEGTDLDLPSGNTCRARQIEPTAFLQSGMIPDPLSSIIRKSINAKQGLPPTVMNEIADDPKKLAAAMELFDRVLTFCVLEPNVLMPPPCQFRSNDGDLCGVYAMEDIHQKGDAPGYHKYSEGFRDEDVLYADQVQMDDKMFVFQWALGGTRDLERFRAEHEANVGTLSHGKAVQRKAKSTSRRK